MIARVRLIVVRRLVLFKLLSTTHHNTGRVLVNPGQVILLKCGAGLSRGGKLVPVAHILLIVQVLTPLNQIVHFVVKILIVKFHKPFVIERVLIQLFKG